MRRLSWKRRLKSQRGQSVVEYTLGISVVAIAVVAAGYTGLIPGMREGIESFGQKYNTYYASSASGPDKN